MGNFPTVQGLGGSLQEALKERVKVNTTATGNVQHVRYDSYSGDWSYGKDNEDITGRTVTIITNSFTHGWHRWADREVYKRMAAFLEDLPEKPDPVEDRKGKTQEANGARGLECVLEDGEDNIQLSWEHSTDGCRRAIDEVLTATIERAQEEPEFLYAVVKLTNATPYENTYKDGEMIYPPTLEILGWRDASGNDAPDGVAKVEDKSKAKAKARDEEPEDAPEEDEDDEPVRQRRRPRKSAA
jgi:hypothetical protein